MVKMRKAAAARITISRIYIFAAIRRASSWVNNFAACGCKRLLAVNSRWGIKLSTPSHNRPSALLATVHHGLEGEPWLTRLLIFRTPRHCAVWARRLETPNGSKREVPNDQCR
jgi:hypothetical protein